VARCSSCSAPLPAQSIICAYCGTRNDIDIELPALKKALAPLVSERMCPDCNTALHSIDVGKNARFMVEKCPTCYGLFFDNFELERLLEASVKHHYWIDYQKVHALLQSPRHKDKVSYRRCPICFELMRRQNYMEHSGVIMDVCHKDGIWLDAGEFKQIQEWMQLGGHNNPSRKKIDHKVLQEQAKMRKRATQNHKSEHSSRPKDTDMQNSDPYLSLFGDLFFS